MTDLKLLLAPASENINPGLLKTTEAKARVLASCARDWYWRTPMQHRVPEKAEFPETESEVVEMAINTLLLEPGDAAVPLFLARKYKKLEWLVRQISGLPVTGIEEHAAQENRYLKDVLVKEFLLCSNRYREAKEQLEIIGDNKGALSAAGNESPLAVVELCERVHDLFEEGLAIIGAREKGPLEERLRRAHVYSYIDGTNKQTLEQEGVRWSNAVNRAAEYKLPEAEVESIKVQALDGLIAELGRELRSASDDLSRYYYSMSVAWRIERIIPTVVNPEVKKRYTSLVLKIMNDSKVHDAAMQLALNVQDYDGALDSAVSALTAPREMQVAEVSRVIEEKILPYLDGKNAKRYVRALNDAQVFPIETIAVAAVKLKVANWLIDEYTRLKLHGNAGYVAARLGERDRAKECYARGGHYKIAVDFASTIEEKVDLSLKEAEMEIQRGRDGIRFMRQGITIAKTGTELPLVFETAAGAIRLLVENKRYLEAVLFGKELGMTKVGTTLPEEAVVQYERALKFGACAAISVARGQTRAAQAYSALAVYFNSSVPETLEDLEEKARTEVLYFPPANAKQ